MTIDLCDLPENISHWSNFPILLTNDEIIKLYSYNKESWILYGKKLNKEILMNYRKELKIDLIVTNFWIIDEYKIASIGGLITLSAIILANKLGLDIAPLMNIPSLKKPGLLVMDMDSTAIQIECIDEIAKLAGCSDAVAKITKLAMLGKIDMIESLHQRVAMLKGVDISILKIILDNLPLTSGLIQIVNKLHLLHWKIAIISSGFKYYASHLESKLNLSYVIANNLEVYNGKLTGKIIGPIVDSRYKLISLKKIAQRLLIPLEQTVAVGDGFNDLLMIKSAALGIAYHANSIVNKQVETKIVHSDLMGIFCILSSTIH
ncbi:phosphoserine phosphatase SerB [Candidatus Pantoea edessiphila]|uniref:Phosphoserine phosphatase n=1 Tax=Candidatus Pantoea edessiphila TaxID=2044610 RepID=A0A2P5SW81_9GAMM|nr:phosphoserine phosphatase SerB [Candidatus Pantoea edessiphila]PPI86571.1 phosphoserine phosphatase SerB [Candidatus Pantoea edessiphila]